MRYVRFLAGRIDDKQKTITEICDHQIVENAALCVCEKGIAQPSRCKTEDVDWNEALKRPCRVLSIAGLRVERDLSHM